MNLFCERSAKCKKPSWNRNNWLDAQEKVLRNTIRGYTKLYECVSFLRGDKINWSAELTKKFLNLNPAPTITELKQVVYLSDSQKKYTNKRNTRDPNKPGQEKYDKEEDFKLLKWEAQIRQEIMQQIIDSRIKAAQ